MGIDFHHLERQGVHILINPQCIYEGNIFIDTQEFQKILPKLPPKTVIALGGDGTFLETVHRYSDCPILGIHFGTRGFLVQKKDEILSASDFIVEEFDLIETKIGDVNYPAGVNEIVIKGTAGHVIDFTVRLGSEILPLRADGCMIATALGSTGYNTSLGGPILLEKSSWVLTPIASLNPRQMNPLVFSCDTPIEIEIHQKRETEIGIYRDGEEIFRGSSFDVGYICIHSTHTLGQRVIPLENRQKSRVSSFFSLI